MNANAVDFSTDEVQATAITTLDNETIIVAWADNTNGYRTFEIFDVYGTSKIGPVNVDVNAGSGIYTSIDVVALNETNFVVGWYNNISNDILVQVFDDSGSNITDVIVVDASVGESFALSVSAFNSTHFVVGWYDKVASDILARVYDSSGNAISGTISVDTYVTDSYSVSVSAFNSTHFGVGWYDRPQYDAKLKIYDSSGNAITAEILVSDFARYGGRVAISTFNETALFFVWLDGVANTVSFKILDSNGSVLIDTVDVDISVGDYGAVSVTAINTTHVFIGWYDPATNITSFRGYDGSGTAITEIIDSGVGRGRHLDIASYTVSTSIGIYDDNFVFGYPTSISLAQWFLYSGSDGSLITSDSCTPPAINNDWTITDVCVKDNENIELGTGSLIINATAGGRLILTNDAYVYANDFQQIGSGEHIHIFSGNVLI